MKKTDMELQAIRDKLRLLESEPPAGETISMPWSSPQASAFGQSSFESSPFSSAAQSVRQPSSSGHASNGSRQATAIEALKHRSGAQASRADELVSQEIYRMEVHAQNINERSQQQATEILALKRSAQQAALALRRQGIHSHPQLDTIAKFLEQYPSAAVPHLTRDSQGHFALNHTTINLHHAEQEAQLTAETLRNRKSAAYRESYEEPNSASKGSNSVQPFVKMPFSQPPFSQPVTAGPSVEDYLENEPTESGSHSRSSRKSRRWGLNLGNLFNRTKRNRPSYSNSAKSRFSWLDGAIWFSGAAIARIMIEAAVLSYPILRMPLLLILFSVISFAIYRVVVTKSSDLTSAYRLGITLLGLFLGSSL
ncbi:MAG: hypothetical protein ACFB0D_02880 [Phormidesmis sp.]